MAKTHVWMLILLIITTLSAQAQPKKTSAGSNSKSIQETTFEFLQRIKKDEKPLRGFSPAVGQKADVEVYFFWASWCEYCEEGYQALVILQNQLTGKSVVYKAVNLDEVFSKEVSKKAKKMQKLEQYAASSAIIKDYPTFQRLPIFIAEDKKTGRLVASTGFSRERFHYFAKSINRMLNGGVSNEE